MYKNKSILAIATARLESKRLKNKNIIKIKKNRCLLDWTFEATQNSDLIDRVVLSTESKKIASIGRRIGFETPFLRPKKFSLDHVDSEAPLIHTLKKLKVKYDYILLLQPTSPLRTGKDIDNSIKKIINSKYQSLLSISKNKKKNKYVINLNKDRTIKFKDEKNNDGYFYYLNGAIFIAQRSFLLKKKDFISKKTGYYLMPHSRSIDIDTKDDLKKLKKILKKKIK